MRLTRVFVASPLTPDADVRLPDAAANHVGRVLRLREGAAIVAFDGSGNDYRC
jgi:16S rRNA (uracil1498-N3)-methyltransferase